jgi:hypothetical protein
MQAAFVLLIALSAAPGAEPPALPPPTRDGLLILRDVGPQQQQAWLRRLNGRLERAIDLTLSPTRAAARKAEVEGALRQPQVPWPVLQQLVDELERRENAALPSLLNRCRVAAYDNLGGDREPYEKRLETLGRAVLSWNAAEKTSEDRDRMIGWLERALRCCSLDATTPIPPPPSFPPEGAEALPPDQPGPGASPEPATPPAEPPPPIEPADSPADRSHLPAEASPPIEAQPPMEPQPTSEPEVEPPAPPVALFGSPPAESATPSTAPVEGPVARAASDGVAVEELPRPVARFPGSDLPGPLAEDLGAQPGLLQDAVEPPQDPIEAPPIEMPRGEPAAAIEVPGEQLTVLLPDRPAAVPATAGSIEPPPRAERPSTGSGVPGQTPARAPLAAPSAPEVRAAAVPAVLNVTELAARIEGVNLELRTLEAQLSEPGPWNAARLAPALERLTVLLRQREDLERLRGLVPAAQRATVEQLEPARGVVAQLGRCIYEARSRTAGADFTGTQAARQEELDGLDALSRRLAALAPGP